jgi:membrane protease YdiL (CAAX protease family)
VEASAQNLPADVARRVASGQVTGTWPWLMLLARTILFVLTGLVIVGIMAAAGRPDPWAAYVPWWPFQVIISNIICYFLLSYLARREGLTLRSLWGYRAGTLGRELKLFLALLIPGVAIGGLGIFGVGYLIYGHAPTDAMTYPLPLAAAIFAGIMFPLTQAVVEITTYMGYSLPRLEVLLRSRPQAMFLAAAGLAVQHFALPMLADSRYILWRILSMLPLALFVAYCYVRTRRLLPLMIIHFLLDLNIGIMLIAASLPK